MHKEDIKNFGLSELRKIIESMGAPGYRAKQIFAWIYKKGVYSFKAMDNLPRPLLDELERDYCIGAFESSERLRSRDGTEKFLFGLSDRNFIETVLISGKDRKTICLSTQVGCKFACPFCASGRMGFVRDLTPSEIIEQVLFLQRMTGHKITNYVFMGMGEPLDNYKNTSKAVLIMNEKQGLAIGARRITISTCGVIPGIKNLSGLRLQVNLSVSLHASNDRLRDRLVPINKKYPLKDLVEACGQYIKKLEPILCEILKKINITPLEINARAKHLYSLYKKLLRHQMNFDKIYDLVAARIIVKDINDCYLALGAIHQVWRPIPGLIKDYIAMPKPNGYQSLHTSVFGPEEKITEIQIRTPEMHAQAENGVSAHWAYKERNYKNKNRYPKIDAEEIAWI